MHINAASLNKEYKLKNRPIVFEVHADNIKEHLIAEYLKLRGYYYIVCEEKIEKFNKKYQSHDMYQYVMKYINTSFKEGYIYASKAVDEFIKENKED